MEVFFVRHGETDHNKGKKHQPGDVSLNERGRAQAAGIRDEVVSLKATYFIASTQSRAQETARIINESTQCHIEYNELFRELDRPAYVLNKKHFSFFSIVYILLWFFGASERHWRTYGGESRLSFMTRLKDARAHLEKLPADARVVVVSHSVFINFFIAFICREKPLSTFEAFALFTKIKTTPNAGILHASYNPDFGDGVCKWSTLPVMEKTNKET